MSLQTLYLPKMGEGIIEAVLLNWLVEEGEAVVEGDPLLEVATDKVDAEIPAAYSGIIRKHLVRKGEVVAIGAAIALLDIVDEQVDESVLAHVASVAPSSALPASVASFPLLWSRKVKLTPLVQHIAERHAIQADELEGLLGCNGDGRITKKILLAYIHRRIASQSAGEPLHLFPETVALLPGDEVYQMNRVRKLIADRMVASKKIAPHVTSFIRVDVTKMVAWRNRYKTAFAHRYGIPLTYTPIFMIAIARALQAFPLLNAVVSGYKVIKRKHINIGFAVALPGEHNLLVPVIKKVEQLDFVMLARKIDALIDKARSGSIASEELTGGSYTISNIGSFDNLMGTPIIVQPQVAILALGTIERRPAVVSVAGQEQIAIRDEMFLSHSYDHRIIDGAIGGGFLTYLTRTLQAIPQVDL